MRTILLSLTALFAISITGCLDEAAPPEPDQLVLTAEPLPAPADELNQPRTAEQLPTGTDSVQVEHAGSADDPVTCGSSHDCADGYACRIADHRCVLE